MFKNIILSVLIFTFGLSAQDFTGVRIYINPGHGGHDGDDRYIAATGFWESDGNLSKGKHLNNILSSLGATTKLSRTGNTTADDLPLSVIVQDANNFEADYFQSIHSNGANGQVNYTLVLWGGTDTNPTYPGSKIAGGYIADEIYKAHRTSTKYNRGEATFYGGPYLGLFSGGLTMPGTLSEGSFHDYIPESWRLRNDAYTKHEAWAITKALVKYFNLDQLPYGEIVGIIRDPFTLVNYYALPFSDDQKKPLNLVKAILNPGNRLYLGDGLNNGFYMFDKVEPGNYQLILEAQGTGKDTIAVSVAAGKTTFADRFLFSPNQRKKLSLVSSFPLNNSENISSTVRIKIHFDGAIDVNSLGGNIFFQDEFGSNVPLKPFEELDYDNGWIIFEPDKPLINNGSYIIKVLKEISDTDGLKPDSDLIINFKVEPEMNVDGTVILDFEDIDVWWQPGQDGSTSGVDLDNTSFVISGKKAIDGSNSGLLTYVFTGDNNGLCRVYYENEPKIPANSNNTFGMWVFGDFSNNYLEYWFRNNSGTNIPILVDTLDWTGWKFKEVDLSGYGELAFHSLVIKQNLNGEKKGPVYFDAMQSDLLVTDVLQHSEILPSKFILEQNYPNPFNPTTTIEYSIPANSFIPSGVEGSLVRLTVYDVLGREVATLVNQQQNSGNYNITFNASDLTSGVYYYTIKVGASTGLSADKAGSATNFVETKKMLLQK